MTEPLLELLTSCGRHLVKGRYEARSRVGKGFGGSSFKGKDIETGINVFMKYLIAPRGEDEIARFNMEVDSLKTLSQTPLVLVPKYLHNESFDSDTILVLVTEWINAEPLSEYLKGSTALPLREKVQLLRRVTFALQYVVSVRRHMDLHPDNILVLPECTVQMGPEFEFLEVEPGIRIVDWGESTPIVYGNYDDEPEHNFTILAREGKHLGGSFVSMPPEVFDPPNASHRFEGIYEGWSLGLLYVRLLLDREPTKHASIGDYLKALRRKELEFWALEVKQDLKQLCLPGGDIIPNMVAGLLESNPAKRISPSDAKLILWHIMEESFCLHEDQNANELDAYLRNPYDYQPTDGWKYLDNDVEG